MTTVDTSRLKIHGICPVMVTPMTEKGTPDKDGIHKLVNYLIDNGAAGLWILGSASEDIHITQDERLEVIKETSSAVNERIPILTGAGMLNINDLLKFIDKFSTEKIDGVHSLYFDHKQCESQTIKEITRLAENSPFPIWLYNNRNRGRAITGTILKELRNHPNIDGVKIGGFSISDLVTAAMMQTESFQVMGAGGAGQFYTMLALGCVGHTASDASCFPHLYKEIYDLFQDGEIIEARQKQFELVKLIKQKGSSAKSRNGEFSAEEKYILSLLGICAEHVNPSYSTLNISEKQTIDQALRDYGFDWAPKAA